MSLGFENIPSAPTVPEAANLGVDQIYVDGKLYVLSSDYAALRAQLEYSNQHNKFLASNLKLTREKLAETERDNRIKHRQHLETVDALANSIKAESQAERKGWNDAIKLAEGTASDAINDDDDVLEAIRALRKE